MTTGAADEATVLFTGGRVMSAGRAVPGAEAVAVRGERIVAVGTARELRSWRARTTEVVDLAGKTISPGFQDAHVHPAFAGIDLLHCSLDDRTGVDEYLAAVAAHATSHPEEAWIVGAGWMMDAFPGGKPRRELLDRVVADRPVFLANADGHGAWVNSAALQRAGFDAATPDPGDGRFERDPDSAPTGLLHEGACDLFTPLLPVLSDSERLEGLLVAQRFLHSVGVTAWQDAIIGDYLGWRSPLPTYIDAAEKGLLTARVVGALWWDRRRGAEQVEELIDLRATSGRDRFAPTVVKIMLDGMVETETAAMLHPYCGTDDSGAAFLEGPELDMRVTSLDAAGFSVHFHACGDRAVRLGLDAVAAARATNGCSAGRHQIAHVDVVHPDDLGRFAELGVTANIQSLWATHEPQIDEFKIPKLGPERTGWCFPFGALHAHGAHLAAGSDWNVSSPDPMAAIHVAVNRRRIDIDAEPWLPEQALAREVSLDAYTRGSAWVNGIDAATGTIEAGKLADLVVLDRDLPTIDDGELAEVGVDQTWVGGVNVHRKA